MPDGEPGPVRYEVDDGVATVTLDRPDRMNAFTVEMAHELRAAFDRSDADDAVRAVVVTGAGRAFCAGADLGAGGGAAFDAEVVAGGAVEGVPRDLGGVVALRIFASRKPVIAAINGAAVGVGITMTLPMDIRVVAEGAKIGFVFAGRGIVPEAASSWFLPRVVGINQALEWCLTARVFRAEEAAGTGLFRSIHPADEVLDVARGLAQEVAAAAAPVSAVLTRQMLWRMLGADHPMAAHRIDSRGVLDLGRGADAHEGVSAFFERRPPAWSLAPSRDLPPWFPWWEEPTYEG